MDKETSNSLGVIYSLPDFIKNNLGTVKKRIGNNGIIQFEKWKGNKAILKLIKEDSTFELLPASIPLSELIDEKKINLAEIMEYDILELKDGYICISNGYGQSKY